MTQTTKDTLHGLIIGLIIGLTLGILWGESRIFQLQVAAEPSSYISDPRPQQ